MTIWKRLRNLWGISKFPYQILAELTSKHISPSVMGIDDVEANSKETGKLTLEKLQSVYNSLPSSAFLYPVETKKAIIIKRNKRNPVKEIVGDETVL